ncbi:MAG: hypothetical protein QOJ23_3466, partial [Actinomycetota bacterium]|nr:hypothetical protein [Actinomycetota bacterium]
MGPADGVAAGPGIGIGIGVGGGGVGGHDSMTASTKLSSWR